MNANPPTGQGRVNIWLDKTEYMLVPGEITTILLTLRNQSLESDRFSLAVDGIPTAWVSASQAALSLTPGEELQTALYIQAPTLGKLESGEIQITIRATSQQHPELYAESQGTLSILRSFAQPCVAVEMESAHFSVSPGGSTTFTLRLTNQGENPDSYRLLIDGIPSGWVSTPSPVVDLESGETREIPLTISPPRASESRAGRHPITIQAISQNFPDQTTVQDGILTIGVFVQFQSELQPTPPLNASQNVHINVTNQGNINESFRIIWESQDDMLAFELWNQEGQDGYFEEIQDHALRVGSGKQGTAHFRAGLRKRPFIANNKAYPFQVHVRSSEYEVLTHTGELNDGGLLPIWVIPLVIVLCLVFASLGVFIFNLQKDDDPMLAQDDSWERVQQAGVLRVATSADYPPFSYHNDDFQIDGFEPALIRDIGVLLGVQVIIEDHAFDGLGAALQVRQVDLAIAALSVNPQREAYFDFSNIYYVGKDGILARANSNIEVITHPDQMAGKRIGVQRSSVYQTWAQDVLVAGGLIPQDQLFLYSKPEHAIAELKNGQLDFVILDFQPATLALSDGELKLVGQGLNQQRFAVAFPKGASTLRTKINEALLTLQNQGRVNQLAEYYLGLESGSIIMPPTPEPTSDIQPAPLPTATQNPLPPPCVDAMEFVEDINYPDDDLTNLPMVDPSSAFQKGWRIRNSGSCTWNSTYFIKYIDGSDPAAQMGGVPTDIQGEVQPGADYDLYIDLVAPVVSGKYVGYWQMNNVANQAFGQTIWVAVEVRDRNPAAPIAPLPQETAPTP